MNQLFSKNEKHGWIAFLFGLFSYTILMFFLLAKRQVGINYINDLYNFNRIILYILCFMLVLLSWWKKKHFLTGKDSRYPLWVKTYLSPILLLLLGFLFSTMFFVIIT